MIKTKALLWTAALLAVSVVAARAELLFTEEFPTAYGEGSVLGNNVTTGGFNTKWGTGNGAGQNGAICTSAGAMVHPTLATITNVQSYGFRAATGTSRDNRATFASQSSGSVYVSFLLKVTAETPTARILAGMRNSTGGGTQAAAMGINSSRQLTVYKNSSSSSATHPTVLNQNETYLVVFPLKFNSGSANDEVAVWLNPTTGGVDESTAGVTPTTTTANSDASSVTSLQLLSALDSSGALYLDEFRVGTDWIEVTPQAGPLVGANLACTTLQQVSFVGEAMHPVIVQVRTAGGLDVPSNNVSVTLALTAGSGNLNGTLTRLTDTNGRAIFDDLSFDTLGNGKQVTASTSGIGAGLADTVRGGLWVIKNPDTVPASSPVITQSLLSGNNFNLRGNNGTPNGEYRVLTSTNAALPLSQWTPITTNNFNDSGAFDSTNPIAPPGSQLFYGLSATPTGSGMFQHMGYGRRFCSLSSFMFATVFGT